MICDKKIIKYGTIFWIHRYHFFLQVVLPTNAYVTVEPTSYLKGRDRGKYLNVYMRGSPKDFGRTEGLCGSYDGDKKNDITIQLNDFNGQWR